MASDHCVHEFQESFRAAIVADMSRHFAGLNFQCRQKRPGAMADILVTPGARFFLPAEATSVGCDPKLGLLFFHRRRGRLRSEEGSYKAPLLPTVFPQTEGPG